MKIEVYIPNNMIQQLHGLVNTEEYVQLYRVFPPTIAEDLDSLTLDLKQAKQLLWAAQIEYYSARLKYPYSTPDEAPFDPEHEACLDEVGSFFGGLDIYLTEAIKELEHRQEAHQ